MASNVVENSVPQGNPTPPKHGYRVERIVDRFASLQRLIHSTPHGPAIASMAWVEAAEGKRQSEVKAFCSGFPVEELVIQAQTVGKASWPEAGRDLARDIAAKLRLWADAHELRSVHSVRVVGDLLMSAQAGFDTGEPLRYPNYIAEEVLLHRTLDLRPRTPAVVVLRLRLAQVALVALAQAAHERRAIDQPTRVRSHFRPPGEILQRRIRQTISLAEDALKLVDTAPGPHTTHPIVVLAKRAHAVAIDGGTPDEIEEVLTSDTGAYVLTTLTVLPRTVQHDEVHFIRLLHCFELLFAAIIEALDASIDLLDAGEARYAHTLLGMAAQITNLFPAAWRVGTTMRPDKFLAFRDATDGSSALGSEQYKVIEALASEPPHDRLMSPAYARHRPAMQAIVAGRNVWSRYVELPPEDQLILAPTLRHLEHGFRVWRQTHYSVAKSILGEDRTGTGGEGLAFLRRWKDYLMFPELAQQQK